jgi:hypothetical protein
MKQCSRHRLPLAGDCLEGITIHKTTTLALVGLVIAILFGAYVVFSASQQDVPARPAGTDNLGSQNGEAGAAQDIYVRALRSGAYDLQEITVNAGVPVRLHFTADPDAGCGRQLVIYGLGVKALSKSGEEDVVEFTPSEEGTYEYNCGMRMWQPGRLVVR